MARSGGRPAADPPNPDRRARLDAVASRAARRARCGPRQHVALLTTHAGAPFTSNGFGNWFADAIDKAGLPAECRTHGLRKAAARRLAEAGCTPFEVAAITGRKSLGEVSRCTREAAAAKLADSAIARLTATKPSMEG